MTPEQRRPAVLVVEDDPDTRRLLELVLRKGYEVHTAATAEEARRQLAGRTHRFRLVLLDLVLEGRPEGFELAHDIRASRRWRDVPVVVASARSHPSDLARAESEGATDYLTKPFFPRQLLTVVERYVPPRR